MRENTIFFHFRRVRHGAAVLAVASFFIFCSNSLTSKNPYAGRTLDCGSPTPFNGNEMIIEIFNSDKTCINVIEYNALAYSGAYAYWNGKDYRGEDAESGVYTIKITQYLNGRGISSCTEMYLDNETKPPAAPDSVRVTSFDKRVSIRWPLVPKATGYCIYFCKGGYIDSTADSLLSDHIGDTMVPGLENGTTYSFAVKAYNRAGFSPLSTVSTLTLPLVVPAPPEWSVLPIDKGIVLGLPGSEDADRYLVLLTDSAWFNPATADSFRFVCGSQWQTDTLKGLKNGTVYLLGVKAGNDSGFSPLSTIEKCVPSLPEPDSISMRLGDGTAFVTWHPVPNATHYTLFYDTLSTIDSATPSLVTTETSIEIKTFVPGRHYIMRITADDSTSQSASKKITTVVTARIPQGLKPGPSYGNVFLSWDKAQGADGYVVYRSQPDDTSLLVPAAAVTNTEYVFSSLTKGALYAFGVASIVKLAYYSDSLITPVSSKVTYIPRWQSMVIDTIYPGDEECTISWQGRTDIEEFILLIAKNDLISTVPETLHISSTFRSYTITGLVNQMPYQAALAYVKNGVRSEFENSQIFKPDYAVPESLMASAGDQNVILSWHVVPRADSYIVYYSEGDSLTKSPTIIQNCASPQVIGNLKNGVTYTFTVSAVRTKESRLSEPVSAAPQVPQPTDIMLVAYDGAVEINWKPAADQFTYAIYYQEGDTITPSATRITAIRPPYTVSGLVNNRAYCFAVATLGSAESTIKFQMMRTPSASCVNCGMAQIPGGTFMMGAVHGAIPGVDAIDTVALSSFWMDTNECTEGEYWKLMGRQFNSRDELDRAVFNVNWFEAILYCNQRSKRDHLDTVFSFESIQFDSLNLCTLLVGLKINFSSNGYRLPTEAEWEYACRGGRMAKYFWGDTVDQRYYIQNGSIAQKVAQKLPNQYDLYDMIGNVCELCVSTHDYFQGRQTDPQGNILSDRVAIRGGCGTMSLYPEARSYIYLDWRQTLIGFRVVRH